MFKSLDHILGAIANQPQWENSKQFQHLLNCWTNVVDPSIAQQTRPYSISRDVLYVATSSSVWVQELQFKRRLILKKLNAQLSKPLVDIHFSTAQWQKDASNTNRALPIQFNPRQEHPSYVDESTYTPPKAHTPLPTDPHSAFQHWAEAMRSRSLSLPLCPQCQCPTPPGELERWNLCGLCAIKQWQR